MIEFLMGLGDVIVSIVKAIQHGTSGDHDAAVQEAEVAQSKLMAAIAKQKLKP